MISLKEESFSENDIINPFWVIRYLENTLPSTKLSSESLLLNVKSLVKKIKGVSVKYRKLKTAKDCFVINGYFDKERKKSIDIEICSSAFKKKINLSKQEYRSLIFEIADALCHESIHRYQYRYKDYSESPVHNGTEEQTYYGDPDEMFCFSVNIAHNLYRQYGKGALRKLQSLKPLLKFDPYLSEYYHSFYNQPQFRKMLKLIYQNIIAIDQGRISCRNLT